MAHLVSFLKIRAVEAIAMLLIFVILSIAYKDVYWPNRPDNAGTVLAGSIVSVLLFFFWWGYIISSGVAFGLSGILGGWRPIWIAIVGALVFGIHSAVVLKLLYFKLDPITLTVWIVLVCLNVALPFLFVRPPLNP